MQRITDNSDRFDDLCVEAVYQHGQKELALSVAMLAHPELGAIVAKAEGVTRELFFAHDEAMICFLAVMLGEGRDKDFIIRLARLGLQVEQVASDIPDVVEIHHGPETIFDSLAMIACCRELVQSFEVIRNADEYHKHARRTLERHLLHPGVRRLMEEQVSE